MFGLFLFTYLPWVFNFTLLNLGGLYFRNYFDHICLLREISGSSRRGLRTKSCATVAFNRKWKTKYLTKSKVALCLVATVVLLQLNIQCSWPCCQVSALMVNQGKPIPKPVHVFSHLPTLSLFAPPPADTTGIISCVITIGPYA